MRTVDRAVDMTMMDDILPMYCTPTLSTLVPENNLFCTQREGKRFSIVLKERDKVCLYDVTYQYFIVLIRMTVYFSSPHKPVHFFLVYACSVCVLFFVIVSLLFKSYSKSINSFYYYVTVLITLPIPVTDTSTLIYTDQANNTAIFDEMTTSFPGKKVPPLKYVFLHVV